MKDICQMRHQITLRVDRLLGCDGVGAAVDVDVYAVAPDGSRAIVHTESFAGKIRDSSYSSTVSVWVDADFGLVSGFDLVCRPDYGAEAEVTLVSG